MKNLRVLLLALSLGLTPALAWAAGWLPLVKSGGVAFSLTYNGGSAGSSSAATTVDFGTLTYGSGCTRVVIGINWLPGGTAVTGVTIGGTNLAQISGAYKNQGSVAVDAWESSAALAGTSGDVQVTFNAVGGSGSSVALYCLITSTPAAGLPVINSVAFNGGPTITATGVVVPSGGGALVLTGDQNGHAISSFTNAAQNVDVVTPPFSTNTYYAHTTSTGTINVTADYGVVGVGLVISVVPWGP